MRFIFDNGDGAAVVTHTPPTQLALCDSNWHSVSVEKNRMMGVLQVDNESPSSNSAQNSKLSSVDVRAPLYAGGLPGETFA